MIEQINKEIDKEIKIAELSIVNQKYWLEIQNFKK